MCDSSTNIQANSFHCGACGNACQAGPNAVAGCVAGKCVVASCAEGFSDADLNASNGCKASCQTLKVTQTGKLDFDLPCGTFLVQFNGKPATKVSLQTSGEIDFNLPLAKITGKVTANGRALTFDNSWSATGTVRFVDAALPCQKMLIKKALSVKANGALDLNVPFVTVTGEVKVNGARMANGSDSRGQVQWLLGSGEGATVSLTETGAATYSAKLAPGTYSVRISNSTACDDGPFRE